MTTHVNLDTPRAIADVTSGTLLATVEIAATPERVFRALTTPDELVRWWGSDELYRTKEWTCDLRVGGAWRAQGEGADGRPFTVSGEYLDVDPPRKLVQTWKPDWDGGHVTTITYVLEPVDGGTRVTVRHEGFAGRAESCRAHGAGWQRVLGWLLGHLAGAPAPERFFLLRLLGPRPTFPADATPDELSLMREHVGYWTGQLQAGRAIVFGPVADPEGTWGLGVVRVPDEATVTELLAGDPVIRSQRGFRYETLPMVRALVRK
jgi:uncharacterized protein YndB with AHSA1/START domain